MRIQYIYLGTGLGTGTSVYYQWSVCPKLEASDVEMEGQPAKTRKMDGAAKYPTKFNSEWTKKWPCVQSCSSKHKFRCTVCQCVVSCEHQGEKYVRRHTDGKKHCSNVQALENQQHIDTSKTHPIQDKVTRAEVKVATVLAHHDIPIAITDYLSPLFKDIFPDSLIAKLLSCARTKTTCILNGALAVDLQKSLVDHTFLTCNRWIK